MDKQINITKTKKTLQNFNLPKTLVIQKDL